MKIWKGFEKVRVWPDRVKTPKFSLTRSGKPRHLQPEWLMNLPGFEPHVFRIQIHNVTSPSAGAFRRGFCMKHFERSSH